ncbi:hypothetical protein [Pseudomonas sp. 13B_3.2_Bac1]|uniref:hypothetical protein n=1 Tax=Pseudomonas sp. 13B_3.2_Bac1 TaxID=2971623 RepID=UPI002905617D|nr:hypothetical protein [Pseudomonas sp. 13B_3.2_Bac1]
MNTTHIFPLKHVRHHPPLVSESPQDAARADWLYNAAEELLRGNSVSFQRRMHTQQGVTAEEFVLAVDEYVNNRLADDEVHTSALGWLIITLERGHADKTATAELLGNCDHPLGKLGEIAEALLEPIADDALLGDLLGCRAKATTPIAPSGLSPPRRVVRQSKPRRILLMRSVRNGNYLHPELRTDV